MIDASKYEKFLKGRIKDLIIDEKESRGGRLTCGPFHMQYSYDIVYVESEQRNVYKYRVNEFGGLFDTCMRDVSKGDIVDFFLQRIFALYMQCRELFEIPSLKLTSHPDIVETQTGVNTDKLIKRLDGIEQSIESLSSILGKMPAQVVPATYTKSEPSSESSTKPVHRNTSALPEPPKSNISKAVRKVAKSVPQEPSLFDQMGPGDKLDYEQYNQFTKWIGRYWEQSDIANSRKKSLFVVITGRTLFNLTFKGLDTIAGNKSGIKFRRWYDTHLQDDKYKVAIKLALKFAGAIPLKNDEWLKVVHYIEKIKQVPLSDNPDCV